MKNKSIVKLLMIVLFIFCVAASCASTNGNSNSVKKEEKVKLENSTVENINNNEFDLNDGNYKVIFIELGSVNCVPCKMMVPVMEEIEKDYKDIVKVVFYDVWTKEGKPFGAKFKIRVIPTQVFLDSKGIEFYRHEGFFPKEEIDKIIKKHLKQ